MVWPWSSSPSAQPEVAFQQPPTLAAPQPSPPPPPKPRSLTRDEQADAELQSFLAELNDSTTSTATSTPRLPSSQPTTSTSTSTSPSTDPTLISPSTLHPTALSCRVAFDAAYYCQLPGGQFVNVYRYGGLRNCSELWSNFWFCMRTNRGYMTDEARAEKVRGYYERREARLRAGPNSEDVWRARERRVEGAFAGDLREVERGEGEGMGMEEDRA